MKFAILLLLVVSAVLAQGLSISSLRSLLGDEKYSRNANKKPAVATIATATATVGTARASTTSTSPYAAIAKSILASKQREMTSSSTTSTSSSSSRANVATIIAAAAERASRSSITSTTISTTSTSSSKKGKKMEAAYAMGLPVNNGWFEMRYHTKENCNGKKSVITGARLGCSPIDMMTENGPSMGSLNLYGVEDDREVDVYASTHPGSDCDPFSFSNYSLYPFSSCDGGWMSTRLNDDYSKDFTRFSGIIRL